MFIRIKLNKIDLITNAERIASIDKSQIRTTDTSEEMMGKEPSFVPAIRIKFSDDSQDIVMSFQDIEERDKKYESICDLLDVKIIER